MRNYIGKLGSLRDRHLKNLSFANTTRRNIYQRRLLCEPLEDRRLLSVSVPTLNSGILSVGSTSISVQYDSAMLGADLAANYQLQRTGVDGLLGTADDVVVPLTVSYQETTAGNSSTLTFAALPEEVYRLTVRDAITDNTGNKLDGNNDGIPGGDWTEDFVVTPIAGLFAAASTYGPSGSAARSVVAGDFNGDGFSDIAVTYNSASTGTVRVFLGTGNGSLSTATTFGSGGFSAHDIVAGDFNRDGKLDLGVANFGSNTIGVLLGNGNGDFSLIGTYDTGGNILYSVAVGDFNGDGNLDFAVTNSSSTVGILLGNGNGTFSAATSFASGGVYPLGIAVGDVNGDGKNDVVVTNPNSDNVAVLLGDGTGSLRTAKTFASGGIYPSSVTIGDVNGDGKDDLVVTNDNSDNLGILLGDGIGGFAAASTISCGGISPSAVSMGDFNKDGTIDLAAVNIDSNTMGVLLGTGGGSFATPIAYATGGTSPMDVAVTDVNGDGSSDLVIVNASGAAVGVLLSLSPVTLNSSHGLSFGIATRSFGAGELLQGSNNAFDGDGRLFVDNTVFQPNTSSYTMADSGCTVIIGSRDYAGLTVSREVTVPNIGNEDFARTIDSFTNNTHTAITTTVTIVGNLGSDDDTRVFATSDGDNIVESTDQWIGTDDADGSGTPAIIHYIHGPAGLQPTSVSMVGDNITWTYEITVAAGETVQLASFTIVGTTQAEAVAAANALVAPHGELREQAGAFLTTAEQQSLANFGVTNYAPVLTAAAVPSLGTTNKDTPITVAVSAFINNGAGTTTITDVDSSDLVGGIALTGTTGNGTWAYSLDGTTFILVDAVSSADALLLPSTAKLRYTPNGKHDETATITFRAWDMTSGISGSKADTSTNGGISAFSEAADTATLTLDYTPPTVIGISSTFDDISSLSPIPGDMLPMGTSALYVYFDSNLVKTTMFDNAKLCRVGADGLLGTTDDTTVVFTSMSYSYNMSNSKSMMTLSFSPLEEGVYRLIVHDTSTDLAGNQLDGNNDGIAGGDWFFDFVIVSHDSNIFATMTTFSSGGVTPCGIEKGDFNGDNKLDLAVTNRYSNDNAVAIFLGDGNGNVSLQSTFNSGGSCPSGIVAADLNNDGLLDLVTGNFNSATLGVFLGNGDGTFTASTPIIFAGIAGEVICEDFNEDGKIDLAVTNQGKVGILLGNGDGSFANALLYSTGVSTMPISLTAGDFDGNGTLDLATGNQGIYSVTILLGDGSGGFSAPTFYSPGGKGLFNIETADFNNDNNLDLVVTNMQSNTVGILLGDGTGHFTTASTYDCGGNAPNDVKVGDFNHDGILDLAVSNFQSKYVSILLGNSDGSFAAALICRSLGNGLNRLVIGDFNGDNAPDLAVAISSNYTVGILLNVINPMLVTLDSPHDMPFDVAAGRFGAGELVQGYNNAFDGYGRLIVGGTPFTSPVSYSTTDGGQSIVTASNTTAGLAVSRKVTVPNTGDEDFARTIDSFTNNTDTAITTTVTIAGNLGSDDDTMVFATSDGDTIVEATDQWIGTDDADGSGTPAIIHYIHGPLGLKPSSVSVIGDNITWTYEITVAAGETVQLASFTIVGTTQAEAVAAANALVTHTGFGGQAAAFLNDTEQASLRNYLFYPVATTTTLLVAPNPSVYGQSVTFTATVSGALLDAGTPAGTLMFVDGSTTLGTATLDANGQAVFTTSLLTAGRHEITASYNGNANFVTSTSAAAIQTVNTALLTIKADNLTKLYGAALPTLTASFDGFVNGETLATSGLTGEPSFACTANSDSPVGDYTITAALGTLGSQNYSFQFVEGKLSITQATPSVSVSHAGGIYNGSPFPATATVTGVSCVPASRLEDVGTTLTYYVGTMVSGIGSANAPSAAGTYTVVASFAGSTNYTAAQSAPATFTIYLITPVVAASDKTFTDKVRVTWNAISDATAYEIWRNTTNDPSTAQLIKTVTGTKYDDTTAVAGRQYWYWVKATNAVATSNYSISNPGQRQTLPATTPAKVYSAVEGNLTKTQVLATFSYANPSAAIGNFTPTVNWGGAVIGTPGVSLQLVSRTKTMSNWKVVGSVIYAQKGTYGITVSIQDKSNNVILSSGKVQFKVADARLTDITPSKTYKAFEGNTTGVQVLAVFKDANPYAPQSDYKTTVTWGGTLIGKPSISVQLMSRTATASTWRVVGNATYADKGTYGISVSIQDVDGSKLLSKRVKFSVADAPLADITAKTTYKATEGNATGRQVLATFTDANSFAPSSDYKATVQWGGAVIGTPSVSVQLVSRTSTISTWNVVGNAVYKEKGVFAVSVSVKDVSGSTVSSSGKIKFNVADAPLTDITTSATYNAIAGKKTSSLLLATFVDADPFAPSSDYKATVQWGGTVIGTPSISVQLVSRTATTSTWNVVGSVKYANAGSYTVQVHIADVHGSSVSTNKTRVQVAAALTTANSPYASAISSMALPSITDESYTSRANLGLTSSIVDQVDLMSIVELELGYRRA